MKNYFGGSLYGKPFFVGDREYGSNLVNMLLNSLFILGVGIGVAGAAVATAAVIGNLVGTLFYIYFMAKKAVVLNMNLKLARENFQKLFSILALAMPNALSSILSGLNKKSMKILTFYVF